MKFEWIETDIGKRPKGDSFGEFYFPLHEKEWVHGMSQYMYNWGIMFLTTKGWLEQKNIWPSGNTIYCEGTIVNDPEQKLYKIEATKASFLIKNYNRVIEDIFEDLK